jgi:hypothetical protein
MGDHSNIVSRRNNSGEIATKPSETAGKPLAGIGCKDATSDDSERMRNLQGGPIVAYMQQATAGDKAGRISKDATANGRL